MIPKNNLWESIIRCKENLLNEKNRLPDNVNSNQLVSNSTNGFETKKPSMKTSTPNLTYKNKINSNRNHINHNKVDDIPIIVEQNDDQLPLDLSPIVKKTKCRKRIVIPESDEELEVNNGDHVSNRSDKTSVDYYSNNRLLQVIHYFINLFFKY